MQGRNFLSQFLTIRLLQEVCDVHVILWVKLLKFI